MLKIENKHMQKLLVQISRSKNDSRNADKKTNIYGESEYGANKAFFGANIALRWDEIHYAMHNHGSTGLR